MSAGRGEVPASLMAAETLLDALIAGGVERVAYCPGSRNAPLAYALAAAEASGRVKVWTFAEERGAAFWALGAAKGDQDGRPVAVMTTSGTAVAELLPALEEARHQGLPLIAVTADRPFDLIGVGASQATRQSGLLHNSVVSECDVPVGASAEGVGNRVRRLVSRALGFGGRSGPAHLNVAFADPLVPPDISGYVGGARSSELTDDLRVSGSPIALGEHGQAPLPSWEEAIRPGLRTVVVAGDVDNSEAPMARGIAAEAARRQLPILAEPSSGLTQHSTWIPHQPWVIPLLADQVEQIIVLGKPTLSRAVTSLLGQRSARKVVISTHDEWPDLSGTAALVVPGIRVGPKDRGGPAALPRADVDTATGAEAEDSGPLVTATQQIWLKEWREAANRVEGVLAEREAAQPLDHATVARAVWTLSEGVDLWIGASGAIRAFDLAATTPGRGEVFSNRGLAGIDGTIAAARGLRAVRRRPLRVVLGDLTFTYDLASLAVPADDGEDVQIIVLDDGGGSIFASLEHGGAPADLYEKFFAVPQNLDVVSVARACGWRAQTVASLAQLRQILAVPLGGRSLIRVPVRPPASLWAALGDRIYAGR